VPLFSVLVSAVQQRLYGWMGPFQGLGLFKGSGAIRPVSG